MFVDVLYVLIGCLQDKDGDRTQKGEIWGRDVWWNKGFYLKGTCDGAYWMKMVSGSQRMSVVDVDHMTPYTVCLCRVSFRHLTRGGGGIEGAPPPPQPEKFEKHQSFFLLSYFILSFCPFFCLCRAASQRRGICNFLAFNCVASVVLLP